MPKLTQTELQKIELRLAVNRSEIRRLRKERRADFKTLKANGYTYEQIARIYECRRQYIEQELKKG